MALCASAGAAKQAYYPWRITHRYRSKRSVSCGLRMWAASTYPVLAGGLHLTPVCVVLGGCDTRVEDVQRLQQAKGHTIAVLHQVALLRATTNAAS